MPIAPENRDRYPADWKAISLAIRVRAGWRCECKGECGIVHEGERERCEERHGRQARKFRGFVVLTVAHLDHTPENCADDNLKAMCQRCHLRYDRDEHQRSRRERRDRNAGQLGLPGIKDR